MIEVELEVQSDAHSSNSGNACGRVKCRSGREIWVET
jgi:hypothetical protein